MGTELTTDQHRRCAADTVKEAFDLIAQGRASEGGILVEAAIADVERAQPFTRSADTLKALNDVLDFLRKNRAH